MLSWWLGYMYVTIYFHGTELFLRYEGFFSLSSGVGFKNAFRIRNVPFYEYATVRLHNFVNHTLNKATNPNYCRYRTTPCMFLQMRNLAVPDSYVYMYLKRNAMTFNFKQ